MTLSSLLLLASICFVAMVSPGPDFLLVSRNALLFNRRVGLATAFGTITGCIVYGCLCALGLTVVLLNSVTIFMFIRYLGAAYLIFLGIKAIASRSDAVAEGTMEGCVRSISAGEGYRQGLLCSLLNPKLALFLISLFSQFITADAGIGERSAVAAVFALEALVYWPILVLLLQARQVKATFGRMTKILDRVAGVLFVSLGLRVALSDLGK